MFGAFFLYLLYLVLGRPLFGFAQEENLMVTRGRDLFGQYCVTCHGYSGKGDGPLAAVLKTPPADLTQIRKKYGGTFPGAKIRQFIDGEQPVPAHGSREMPVWGKEFRRDKPGPTVRLQISAFTFFIESIQE
jgi:mono/diheme cytochrome c family protein